MIIIKTERHHTSEGKGEPESIHEEDDAHVEKQNPGGVPPSRHQRLFRTDKYNNRKRKRIKFRKETNLIGMFDESNDS